MGTLDEKRAYLRETKSLLYQYLADNGYAITSDMTLRQAVNLLKPSPELFQQVNWLDTAYVVGQNTEYLYNGWCPGNAVYDKNSGNVVFLQSHGSSHSAGVQARTLCTVNPYRPMDCVSVDNFPDRTNANNSKNNGVGGLVIDGDGSWHVYGKKYNYHSQNGGETWTTETVETAPVAMYGVTKIDDVLFAGDDSSTSNGVYFTSHDNGLNWQTNTFDFADDYAGELTLSEASFCKFKGEIYACLRRKETPGILAKQTDGVWTVVNDAMPNVTSDTSMYAVDDAIYFASIDRPNRKLILSSYDGNKLTTHKEYNFSELSTSGDFHTPSYIAGDDFQMVVLMTGYGMDNGYGHAINACVVGYKDGVERFTPTYNVELTTMTADDIVQDGPMTGTITVNSASSIAVTKDSWYNIKRQFVGIYPPNADGHPVQYGYTSVSMPNRQGQSTYSMGQGGMLEIDGEKYLCYATHIIPTLKLMGKCREFTKTSVDMTGAQYCYYAQFAVAIDGNATEKTSIVRLGE